MNKYPPPYHQSHDQQKMLNVIKQYPLAILVSVLDGKPMLTHIPIIYNEESGKLVAHIDLYNPQVKTLQNGAEVTVIFKGPDAYISPSVYSTKQLPTWNYMMVHLKGTITLIDDLNEAKDTMIAMTQFLEGTYPKFILEKKNKRMDAVVNYIQAFTINIIHWEGKFKLSQDKRKQDQVLAKEALIKKSNEDITEFIEEVYQ